MAKSFKKAVPGTEHSKKTSEKDFLDFLEQDRLAAPATTSGANKKKITNNPEAINTNGIIRNTQVTSVTNDPNVAAGEAPEAADVRQTFILGSHYLEQLKDYVHTRRAAGQYNYTQKQALHEALELLFASATIEPRPVHIREQEESRRQRIRRGLPK